MALQTRHELPLWSFDFNADSKFNMLSRQELERDLLKKVWEDKAFKEELLNNPKATIERVFGIQLPDSLSIEVLEETNDLFYMIIPQNPYSGTPEPELKQALGMDLDDIALLTIDPLSRSAAGDGHNGVSMVAKAWRDTQFKERLLAAPEATLAAELSLEIRNDVAIHALEEFADKVYFVIPFFPDYELMEADSDLLAVNMPIAIGSDASIPSGTFAINCTESFTCPIP